jgi:two-component system OmpR family response regulator
LTVRVLVVEDDATLARRLREDLTQAGFAVDLADNGIDAEHLGDVEPYETVVLDLGLPGRSGLDVLRNWRQRGNAVPVVILTARDAWNEKVDGFQAGADDYVAKPFHVEELIARIQAVTRRRHGHAEALLRVGGLTLDPAHQTVSTADGVRHDLTGTEFRLLQYFMLHPGHVLSKTRLTEQVYAFDADKDSNVIEVYVKRLRQKLGKDVIQTRRGQGYVFGSR